MSRSEQLFARWPTSRTILVLLSVAIAGCAQNTDQPRPSKPSPPVVQADASPLPDFHQYVVGALDEPAAASRDPFVEMDTPTSPSPLGHVKRRSRPPLRFSLRGIVERNGRRVALFARGSVSEGQTLAGWTVVRIDERSVLLRRGDREKRLSL